MNLELPKKNEKKSGESEKPLFNRREAAQIIAGGAAAGVAGALLIKESIEGGAEPRESRFEQSEVFERQLSGYRILYGELERDEILFVDRYGAPISGPIKIEPVAGISPGPLDTNRLLIGELNQRWLNFHRTQVCSESNVPCDLRNSLPRQLNSIRAIREAVNAGLNPSTFLDIVRHYGGQRLASGESKIEFVRTHAMERVNLPAGVERELSRLLPGLAAQESRYNDASVSRDGATGTFQFMPNTWRRELGYTPAEMSSFERQVEGLGRYFSSIHQFLTVSARTALAKAKQEYFDGNEEAFEKFFLVPVMINAYNAGPPRLAVVVRRFLERYPDKQALEALMGAHSEGFGYDAYIAMARETSGQDDGRRKVPRYGRESSEYVPRVYALADLLD